MTPLRPGAAACQACLALSLLLGHEDTELAHSTHVCGSLQQELCVDNQGSQPHVLDEGMVFPVSVGDSLAFRERLAVERVG